MNRQEDNGCTKVLVLHQGAIGDFVLTLAVVQAVRASLAAHDARITALASAASASLAAGRSTIDAYVSPERAALHGLFGEQTRLDDTLSTILGETDLVLSFLGNESSHTHLRLCRATKGKVVSVDPRPTPETMATRQHITSQWLRTIVAAGITAGHVTPPRIKLEAARRQTKPRSDGSAPRHVIVHPGSGGRDKCWPLERFAALVDSLNNTDVSWMLGAVELDRDSEQARAVGERVARCDDSLIVEDDLLQAAQAVVSADLYIGNDGGMTHVAAALGVPTVAIFGPTDPRIWRPLGQHVTVLEPEQPGELVPVNHARQVVASLLY